MTKAPKTINSSGVPAKPPKLFLICLNDALSKPSIISKKHTFLLLIKNKSKKMRNN